MNTCIYIPEYWERADILDIIEILQAETNSQIVVLLDEVSAQNFSLRTHRENDIQFDSMSENEELHRIVLQLSSFCDIDMFDSLSSQHYLEKVIYTLKVLAYCILCWDKKQSIKLFTYNLSIFSAIISVLEWEKEYMGRLPQLEGMPKLQRFSLIGNLYVGNSREIAKQINKVPSTDEGISELERLLEFFRWISLDDEFIGKTGLLRREIIERLSSAIL